MEISCNLSKHGCWFRIGRYVLSYRSNKWPKLFSERNRCGFIFFIPLLNGRRICLEKEMKRNQIPLEEMKEIRNELLRRSQETHSMSRCNYDGN